MALDLNGQTVLVTGGTGSFGTAFTARMLKEFPDIVLRIFSRDELKQSEMATKFDHDHRLRFFVGDVHSRERLITLRRASRLHRPRRRHEAGARL